MPVINLKISGKEDLNLAQSLAGSITELIQKHLNKDPTVTAITVTFVPDVLWFIDAQSLGALNLRSFYLDIKVSDSTNVKDQKANYIDAVYQLLSSVCGSIHPASYVYVEEVKADAYGFAGLTMEHRYIHKKSTSFAESIVHLR